jgi:hypothetical protein
MQKYVNSNMIHIIIETPTYIKYEVQSPLKLVAMI